jgi:hypothetical protein
VLSLFGSFGNESAYHEIGITAANFEHHTYTLHPDDKSSRTTIVTARAGCRVCITLMINHTLVEYKEN